MFLASNLIEWKAEVFMYEFAVEPAITQIRRPGVRIIAIDPNGLAAELGLSAGDRIVRVNGHQIRDYLDFRFQTAGETELVFLLKKANGETIELEFDRELEEDFGIEFEQIVPRQCANECIFCFCKGNPENARPSLFIRDEDIRLSFLYGNYTTLTSITKDEMQRIIEQRLSPQFVSVHATDVEVRAYLLGIDKQRADIWAKLSQLLENGIEVHAQIVLCPGINDGIILEKTLRDLACHYPKVLSAAIVPVALTRYNTDERLKRVTREFCLEVIESVSQLQQEFRRNLGTNFAFLGDEIYLKAGKNVPARSHYGNYPQIEDGVGMVRNFLERFDRMLKGVRPSMQKNARLHSYAKKPATDSSASPQFSASAQLSELVKLKEWSIITGEMFAPILSGRINKFNQISGENIKVISAKNEYFGGDVAVAGLISGNDFLRAASQADGNFTVIPKSAIKSDEPVFIDGMTLSELEAAFTKPIFPLDADDFFLLLSRKLQQSSVI